MSTLNISVELLENDKTIVKKILSAIAEDFNHLVNQKIQEIKRQISEITVNIIKNTTTYTSLVSGELAGHFGLPAGSRRGMVDTIINTIGKNIEVDFHPITVKGNDFSGGIEIGALLSDFSDILNLSEATVVTEKSQQLPWLEWLIIRGNKIIISEHEVHLIGGRGRSGRGIMVKNNASVWRVPPQYAGTMNNNWLIKAFADSNYEDLVNTILQKELS